MKFPTSSLDDLIDFLAYEKLTDHIKSWQNFRKFCSGYFELLPFLSSNDPTDKNAFGQFGWFSRVRSHMYLYSKV